MYHVSLTSARESILTHGLDASKHNSPWAEVRAQGKLLADQPVGNYVFSNLRSAMAQQILSVWQDAPTDIWHVNPLSAQWILDPELIDYANKSASVQYWDGADGDCHEGRCNHEQTCPRWYSPDPIAASALSLIDCNDAAWQNIAHREEWLACMNIYAEGIQWSAFHIEGRFNSEARREVRAQRAMERRAAALNSVDRSVSGMVGRRALPANVV